MIPIGKSKQTVVEHLMDMLADPLCLDEMTGYQEKAVEKVIALLDGIEIGRLEAICDAERDGRCVVLPIGKIGEYVEWSWNGGISAQLFMIHNILVCRDGIRYVLGDFEPFANSTRINRILTRAEAESALKGDSHE